MPPKKDEIIFNKKLIKLIKEHQSIYDRHYVKKQNERKVLIKYGWSEISQKLEKTVEECEKKWKSIRQSYNRSLKQNKSTYYLHDEMKFLQPYLDIDPETKEKLTKLMPPPKIPGKRRFSTLENERDQNSNGTPGRVTQERRYSSFLLNN